MAKQRLLIICGTRPEVIKLAPLIPVLSQRPEFDVRICTTGQHREMLDQMLEFFSIKPDFDLSLMQPEQSLSDITRVSLDRIENVFKEFKPDWVIVQGDTTTAFACSLAAFYHQISVAHVEAGLRTYNPYSPWPEEMNRKLIGSIAAIHYAPTQATADNLRSEHIANDHIVVTGNTVIDALFMVRARINQNKNLTKTLQQQFDYLNPNKRLLLVTAHCRENWDGGLAQMFEALKQLAMRGDIEIIYPVHLNPKVQSTANQILTGCESIHLIDPLDYVPFVYLLQRCNLVITDSGGVQEEAPSLGKPIIVTRDTTERPEGINAGTAILAGTETQKILQLANDLLDDQKRYQTMAQAHNPYGDGKACKRIVSDLLKRING